MPTIDIVKSVNVSRSIRARQLETMFDVPAMEKCKSSWHGELPIDNENWNIGLIVGSSGSGKSTIGKELFKKNYDINLEWKEKSVIDDFSKSLSIEDITKACSSVGFNTIPSWLKPYSVLSTGEKFRVDMARRILELESPIVIDEFTSVIDRQVAKIGCHAIQKFIRRNNKQFIAISCHYDIIDWLQPDWIFEPATMEYRARGLLQRPEIDAKIRRVNKSLWKIFSKYHYMSTNHNKAAKCFALFVNNKPICFNSVLHLPNMHYNNLKRLHRVVTLPDYQGIGFVHVLMGYLGAAYKALGIRLRAYPKHPPFIINFNRNKDWALKEKSKIRTNTLRVKSIRVKKEYKNISFNNRFTGSIFEYIGPKIEKEIAEKLINGSI